MNKTLGLLAEFENPATLMNAAEKFREAGYKTFDCHSPFPIHGMDEAMGLKRSPIGYIVGAMAVTGAALGIGIQYYASVVAYPHIISGKPFFSWQAYVIITFALFILLGAFAAVIGMLKINGLPRFYHPVFYSDNFKKFSDDGFFVSVESDDPAFDIDKTKAFMDSVGGKNIEVLEGE